MYTAAQTATTLIRAIQKIRKENQNFEGRHGEALQQLAKVFSITADNIIHKPTTNNQKLSTPTAISKIQK